MIKLQSEKFEIDLSSYGVTLNAENDIFSNNIYKSYSLPFTIKADDDLLVKLDLPTEPNIINVNSKIPCRLLLHDRHFPATLYLGEFTNNNLECNITYGQNGLKVYETEIKNLPWPAVIHLDLRSHAKDNLQKSWPDTTYQFPMVYKPDIDGDVYDRYEGFLNNYDPIAEEYKKNEVVQEMNDDNEFVDVYVNRNVMAPFPYLIEILRMGYAQENKQIVGGLILNEAFKKILYIPENFLEKFENNQFERQTFAQRTTAETIDGNLCNVYRHEFQATEFGTYELSFKLNIPPAFAAVFDLTIYRKDAVSSQLTEIKKFSSVRTRVTIEDKIEVNVDATTQYDNVVVKMILNYNEISILDYNSFEWSFGGGQLNIFPEVFYLSEFVPDMTFGDFVNTLKNWLNLDITILENTVSIDFVEKSIFEKKVRGHSNLEIPSPTWKNNNNRFFKLKYADGSEVFYNKLGQVYSDIDYEDDDVVEINMDLQSAIVESNKNITTAVAPKDSSDIDFLIFSGSAFVSAATSNLFSLQNVLDNFWLKWLNIRVHSKSIKEYFECSVFEEIEIDELSNKYNENIILKKIKKKFLSEKRMKATIEGETF